MWISLSSIMYILDVRFVDYKDNEIIILYLYLEFAVEGWCSISFDKYFDWVDPVEDDIGGGGGNWFGGDKLPLFPLFLLFLFWLWREELEPEWEVVEEADCEASIELFDCFDFNPKESIRVYNKRKVL